jgi:hypothetical protein
VDQEEEQDTSHVLTPTESLNERSDRLFRRTPTAFKRPNNIPDPPALIVGNHLWCEDHVILGDIWRWYLESSVYSID